MKNTKIIALSAAIAAAMSVSAHAENHKFEVRADAGRIFFDEPLDDSNIFGLGFGYVINQNWTLEANASQYDTETDVTNVDIEGTQYRLDALYNINTESLWRPYVAFGVGDQEREWDGDETDDTLVNLGAGVKRNLGGNWEFRTDVRAFNSLDNEYTDMTVTAGLAYLFGGSPAPVKVAPAPEPVKEVDSDGDGVFDSKDQCPDTLKQYKVDSVGCPMELTETVSMNLDIKFDSAKAVVKDAYLPEVQKLATFMNQYANTVVTVEGHTDSQGADAYNQKLSQQRADAVKATLITKFGIDADRVTAVGYGEARPLADNNTADGRLTNRRVVGAVSTAVTRKEVK